MFKQKRGSALPLVHDIEHKYMSRSQTVSVPSLAYGHYIVPEMASGEAGMTI